MEVVQDDWKAQVKCESKDLIDSLNDTGCGAVLDSHEDELILMYWQGIDFRHYYLSIQCPYCKKYNRVRELPPFVLERAKTPEREKSAIFDGISE